MGFLDSLKMALHNLWHNKSRTLLTVIIVFVVSTLIMAMCLLGTNFITNQEDINRKIFSENGTTYSLYQKQVKQNNQDYTTSVPLEMREVEKVAEISRKHLGVVDSFYVTGNSRVDIMKESDRAESLDAGYADFTFPFGRAVGTIKEGRLWNESDKMLPNIWVSEKTVQKLSAQSIACAVGDKLNIKVTEHIEYDYNKPDYDDPSQRPEPKTFTAEYTVAGVIYDVESKNSWETFPDIYMSLFYVTNEIANIGLRNVTIAYNPVGGSYSYTAVEKQMKAYEKEVQAFVGKNVNDYGNASERFRCEFLDSINMTRLMGYIIMGVLALLAFFILLLSVGSVANTIIISIDKNRKFIGLMKAMGLNNRGVKGIVYKEAIITIALGVLLGILVILALSPVMTTALNAIMGGMFMMMEVEVSIAFTLHFYIPLITMFAFIGLALAFSRGSVTRMGKADVISIISEVA